jgi:predicted phosphodiesterase
MRLWILSDLHLEQSRWDLPQPRPDFDVLVAAGDIHDPASDGVRWLAERVKKPVVYVPGNHEWYAAHEHFTVADETACAMQLASQSNVHFLMDRSVVIDGVRFLGASLWTDYRLYGTPATSMKAAAEMMNDHRFIFPAAGSTPLTPSKAREWHETSRRWLEDQLLPGVFEGTTVVVTHHLPHERSIASRYVGDALNPAFCSDLGDLVERSGAAVWVHGHTHVSFDYQAGSTRVVCNPKGYGPVRDGGRYENAGFDPRRVIEIEPAI